MLGNLLWDIDLPGSHGVISAWSPPRVGLDLTVLQDLENNLWDELYRAILYLFKLFSRHASRSLCLWLKSDICPRSR